MSTRVLADGNEIPLLGLGVWQVPDGPRVRGRGALGARARLPPHRHRAGLRQRARASAGPCATAACRARRSSSRRSSTPARKDAGGRGAAQPRAARRRPRRPLHHPLAAGRADLGVGRACSARTAARLRALDRRLQLQRRPSSTSCSRSPTSPPVVNQVQFSPFEYRRALLEACEERGIALEAYSPLGTGRHLDDARVARDRRARRPHARRRCCIRWALQREPHRAAEVDAPRAHRGERAGLRLRALRRGHGRAGRARPDRRHRAARSSASGGEASAPERPWATSR